MQAEFGIERELCNNIIYKECVNDGFVFHFHSQIELCIVDEGEMEITVNDMKRCLKKGEMSIAMSFDAHSYKTINHSKSRLLIIPSHLCGEFTSSVKSKRFASPFFCNTATVKKIGDCFNEIKNTNGAIKQIGYIYVILGTILDTVQLVTGETVDAGLSSKILMYIHKNYRSDITLASIASEFGYSECYISRYFKSCFNIGFNRYLNIIRLRNAIMLLRKEQCNITGCALDSGFNSLRTFHRVFKKEFGCSPKEYINT